MNRKRAKRLLDVGKSNPITLSNGKVINFIRADMNNVRRIEKLSDKELINEWKNLTDYIEICCSISDIQECTLLEMEMDERGITEKIIEENKL
jgi:hypothetical protein